MRAFVVLCFLCFFSPAIASCPEGSLQWKDYCYFYQSNVSQIFDAELACNALNGNLVSIHDGFTNGIIASQISKYLSDNGEKSFWIGLNALNAPGNWSWTDLSPFDYEEWKLPAPENPTLNCAAITLPDGSWIADDCSVSKPFICEVNITEVNIVTTPTPTVTYSKCSEGYFYFDLTNSCYGNDKPYNGSWGDSRDNCKTQGGNLVSIHSPEEANFISTLISLTDDCLYVGLNYDDKWQWSDGSDVDYLPWDSGYPNAHTLGCILNNKLRNPGGSWYSLYSICKKPALLPVK